MIATNGYYVDKQKHIEIGIEENKTLLQYFDKSDTILEFGSGIGKNLIALSNYINFGCGIDINPYYQIDIHLRFHGYTVPHALPYI